jgi:hypothetical protein
MTAASSARQLLIKPPLKVLLASGSSASHLRTDVSVKSLPGWQAVLNLFPNLQKKFLNSEEAGSRC